MRAAAIFGGMAALAWSSATAADHAPTDVWGLWYTPDRDSLVLIEDCGDGTPCGTVQWVDPVRGQVFTDEHNPNEALRGRPMAGVVLLSGFDRSDKGWGGGEIYHPGKGVTYRAKVRRLSSESLKVSGCVGPICKGMTWHKAEDRMAGNRPPE